MQPDTALTHAGFASLQRVQFALGDLLRSAQGRALGAFGLDPVECAHRVVESGPFWQLRDYGDEHASSSLLIVAAPIKRPYIWDLLPSLSPIRYCRLHGQRVFLVEWLPATDTTGSNGIEQYTAAISACAQRIESETGVKPVLMGHSLGGTLAALFAAKVPEAIRALVLLSSPLCFAPATCRFRDALVSLVPPTLSDADPCPGSLLSQVSALASPETFVWSRLTDAVLSAADRRALDVHARVERWALDEVPLAGRLVHQIVNWLYRENRFCRGTLQVGDTLLDPSAVRVPTLAVVNTSDAIAPLASVEPFIAALEPGRGRIIEYEGEFGIGLQHLGVLIGRQAHARLWPKIIAFLTSETAIDQMAPAETAAAIA